MTCETKPKLSKAVKSAKPKGRTPLPDALRRRLISVRILPQTVEALEAMNYENLGRAIDALVTLRSARLHSDVA